MIDLISVSLLHRGYTDLVGGPGLKHQLLIDPVEDPILPGVLEQEQQACVGGEMTGGEFDTIDHGWILSYRSVY